ncbi:hypothetical protein Tco_1411485 [Tanacetum coccineum]
MQNVPYASAIGSSMYATAVKTILKYMRNTKDMVLDYGENPESELKVTCYADVGFHIDKDDTKSQSGYVFMLNGGAMRKFIDGLRDVMPSNKRPMEILCDNAPAISIANASGIMRSARHYQRKYHYVHEVFQPGEIVLKKVHTDDNLADPFTKLIPYNKHFEHAMVIDVCPANSLM